MPAPLVGAAVHDADGHMTKLCEVASGGTVTRPSRNCTALGSGATTLALVWNALDHLNTATRTGTNAITESYVYDDQGRRIAKTSAGATTSYLYDGDDPCRVEQQHQRECPEFCVQGGLKFHCLLPDFTPRVS